jgi:hypothetical protein
VLIAKKNSARIRIGADTVRNGDRYRVLAAEPGENAGLVVEDLRGRGTTTLPTEYLARYTEYGWAATIDGAQGATADIGILLARSGLDREHLYVAMSRGRQANHVHTTPELNTGDAGPHRPTRAQRQPLERLAQARMQPPEGGQSRAGSQTRLEAPSQLPLPDLDAAITQLTAAVTTSGRERAAHSLLDPAIAQARERDWVQRESQHPPRPVPAEHVQNQHDLDNARSRLEQAHDHVGWLASRVHDLQNELDDVPRWTRSRRQALTNTLAFTQDESLPRATNELSHAASDVDALTQVVDTQTQQRLDSDAADRERRHRAWLGRSDRPYVDPQSVIAPADRPGPFGVRPRGRGPELSRTAPQPPGSVQSR